MKTKTILSLLLLCFYCLPSVNAQEKFNVINIHFLDKKYQQLQLTITYGNNQTFKTNGKVDNRNKWTFAYPDSLFEKLNSMEIDVPSKVDSIKESITFIAVINNDTLRTVTCSFSPGVTNITASYVSSLVFPKNLYFNKKKKSPAFRTRVEDQFIVSPQSDKELLSSIEAIGNHYSFFVDNVPYDKQLLKFKQLSNKYPDSRLLISILAKSLTYYKSKPDVASLFVQFSGENRKSFFGQKIYQYLYSFNFKNEKLPQWETGVLEPIVKDSAKFNLIIFSASWCKPCHELVPVLKQLYNELKGNVELTYISMDEANTVGAWRKFMITDHIPWRSLLAEKEINTVRDKYYALTIPYLLLIYPNNTKTEVINIRKISEDANLISRIKALINSAHQKE